MAMTPATLSVNPTEIAGRSGVVSIVNATMITADTIR